MATAKVFRSGNSQAVRLPKQFRLLRAAGEVERAGELALKIYRFRRGRKTSRNDGEACNGSSVFAGHQYLHLHPPKEA